MWPKFLIAFGDKVGPLQNNKISIESNKVCLQTLAGGTSLRIHSDIHEITTIAMAGT